MMGFGDRFRKLNDDEASEGVPEDEIAATGDGPGGSPELADEQPKGQAVDPLGEAAATSSEHDEEPGQEPEAKPRRRLFSRKPKEAPVEDEIAATEVEDDQPAPEEPEVETPAQDEAAATEVDGAEDGSDATFDPDELIEIPAFDEAAATAVDPEPERPKEPRRRPFSRRPKAKPAEDEIAASEVEGDESPTAEQPAIAEMTATGDAPRPKRRRPFSRKRKRGPAEPEIAASTAIDEETSRAERASLHSKFRRSNGSRGRGGDGHDGIPPLMRAFNLLPEERRAETRHFQTKPVHLVLGALIPIAFVAVGLMYFTADAAKSDKQAERDEISARLTALRAQLDEGDAPASDTLASQALAVGTAQWTSTVATALSERVSWDRVLQDADRVLPPNTYFETLAASPGSGTADAPGAESTTTDTTTDTTTAETADSGLSRLTITGFAPDHETVAIYLRRVQALRDVDSASLTSTARAGTLGVLRFIIEAEVRPSR